MRTIVKSSKLLMLILAAAMTVQTHAQEEAKSKKDGDIDSEITNARLRAESGSKSPFSFSLSVGYSGGSITDPFDAERPNIYGNPEEQTATSIDGSFSARYRFSKNDSISLGAGFALYDPWGHSVADVSNPYIGYSRVYKLGIFQTISAVDYTHGTDDYWDVQNISGVVGLSHNMMASIKDTGFTLGVSIGFNQYLYEGLAENGTPKSAQTNYSVGLYPQLEYVFNDTYSFRTVFGYFNFKNYREDDATKLTRSYEYQSVGVGISVTRDVYVYPNVQFLMDDIDGDKTNLAISATINLL
ncbi:hypothetical protein ACRXCV_06160 [Halobacteriovorax sp. GFR7]|uniref:hypothetical protein n=1 Tax=unclassified Halobacteriovorax TaxID=2639665 RepID=UPI003D989201